MLSSPREEIALSFIQIIRSCFGRRIVFKRLFNSHSQGILGSSFLSGLPDHSQCWQITMCEAVLPRDAHQKWSGHVPLVRWSFQRCVRKFSSHSLLPSSLNVMSFFNTFLFLAVLGLCGSARASPCNGFFCC